MVECGQQVGFTLEVLDDGFPNEWVRSCIDHFLDRYQLGDIGKVHIAGAIDRTHPAYTDHFLNRITIGKCYTCLKLTWGIGAFIALIVGQLGKYTGLQGISPK